MRIFTQTHSFFISTLDVSAWPFPEHRHNHYEMIFIANGSGIHHINGMHFPYKADDIFLFNMSDYHHFDIEEKTCFYFIKVQESFFNQQKGSNEKIVLFNMLKPYLDSQNRIFQYDFSDNEKQLIRTLILQCVTEFEEKKYAYEQVIRNQLLNIYTLIARKIMQHASVSEDARKNHVLPALVQYIQEHVQEPELLKAAALAAHFHISEKYIGQMFKKHTEQTLKHYIEQARISAIKNQLLHGNKTVAQLAFDYGFTDESHLINSFKKWVGNTPSRFRQAKQAS